MQAARVIHYGGRSDEAELIQAAMRGDVQDIERLLSPDHHLQRRPTILGTSSKKVALNINATDKIGRTALHWIASQGHEHCIDIIMQHSGTNPLVSNKDGRTPLHEAVMKGHMNIVSRFFKYDIFRENINQEDRHKRTALHWAALGGYKTILTMLVQNGADIKKTCDVQGTALHVAINAGHDAIKWILLRAWAAQVGDDGVIRILFDDGKIQADAKDEYGRTLLSYASESGHEAIVKLLIEKRADIETKDTEHSRTPLSWAAEKGREAVVKLLIEKGADIEAKDISGQTPLLWAAEKGREAVVKLLIKKGADIEAKDKYGGIPLLLAARNGYEAVVKLLIEKGADIEAKDIHGQTPLLCVAAIWHEAILKLLIEKGADIEAKDKYGRTPLLLAAEKGHEAVIKLLVEANDKYGQ